MPNANEENVVEASKGSAGEASGRRTTRVSEMSMEPDLLTRESLGERQRATGGARKLAGPPLRPSRPAAERASIDPTDVSETPVADAPAQRDDTYVLGGTAAEMSGSDTSQVTRRAEQPGLLTPDELEARQQEMGRTRRSTGPPMEGRRPPSDEPPSGDDDVPPTEPQGR